MYIEIGDAIGLFLNSKHTSVVDRKKREQIENILFQSVLAMEQGHHCVNTQSDKCALLICKNTENPKVKRIYHYIYQHYSTYLAGFKNRLTNYVRIELVSNEISRSAIGEDKCVTIVNLNFAERTSFWQSVAFLPENIRDYRFFTRIACYKKDAIYKAIRYSFVREQGQGSRAIDTYECRCSEKRFIFALIDNDISAPNTGIKKDSTADKFLKSKYKNAPNGFVHILNVHELENLFSSNAFISKVNGNVAKKIESYGKIDPNVTIYYDMKEGFSFKKIMQNAYMRQFASEPIQPCALHLKEGKCLNKKCGKSILPGLGSDYLEKLFGDDPNFTEDVESIDNKTQQEFSAVFKDAFNELIDPIKKEWENIYVNFLTYFCSYPLLISAI